MKLLIDTHTFLWFVEDSPKLSLEVRSLLEEEDELLLSVGSLWEIAIKTSLGKLVLNEPVEDFMNHQLSISRIDLLPIAIRHLSTISDLPFYHRDPFDRLLIAQAIVENLPIVSNDLSFDAYPIKRIW